PGSDPVALFCSEYCEQEAKYVRYARAVLRDGRSRQPDVRDALEIREALLLGGGYPARARTVPRALREAVFARDGRRCHVCGGPADEIDHLRGAVDGDPNHPDNLRAVCGPCNRRRARDHFVTVTRESDPEEWARCQATWAAWARRIAAEPP